MSRGRRKEGGLIGDVAMVTQSLRSVADATVVEEASARSPQREPGPGPRAKPLRIEETAAPGRSAPRRAYAVIPAYSSLSPEARAAIITDGYPIRVVEHLPAHRTFLEFLIDRSLAAWTHSQG